MVYVYVLVCSQIFREQDQYNQNTFALDLSDLMDNGIFQSTDRSNNTYELGCDEPPLHFNVR